MSKIQKENAELLNFQSEEQEITLNQPIKNGEQIIRKVIVSKPNVRALMGASLRDIYNTDVTALCKVLPKVTNPILTQQMILNLDPVDLSQLGGQVVYFLQPKEARDLMDQQMEQIES